MLAYKKSGNDSYVTIEVDVDDQGQPLLPEGAIVEAPPAPREGYTLTIIDGKWEYVEELNPIERTVETVREEYNIRFSKWEQEYLNRPFIYAGKFFINHERFREMINSAMAAMREWGALPELWLTGDEEIVSPVSRDFLDGLAKKAYMVHQNAIATAIMLKGKIGSAKSIEELEAITFPEIESDDVIVYFNNKHKGHTENADGTVVEK